MDTEEKPYKGNTFLLWIEVKCNSPKISDNIVGYSTIIGFSVFSMCLPFLSLWLVDIFNKTVISFLSIHLLKGIFVGHLMFLAIAGFLLYCYRNSIFSSLNSGFQARKPKIVGYLSELGYKMSNLRNYYYIYISLLRLEIRFIGLKLKYIFITLKNSIVNSFKGAKPQLNKGANPLVQLGSTNYKII